MYMDVLTWHDSKVKQEQQSNCSFLHFVYHCKHSLFSRLSTPMQTVGTDRISTSFFAENYAEFSVFVIFPFTTQHAASAVFATAVLSVRLSDTFVISVETAKCIINFFSLNGNPIILAFAYHKITWQNCDGVSIAEDV